MNRAIILIIILLTSCSTAERIYKIKSHGQQITAHRGTHKGIRYLRVETKQGRELVSTIAMDCECDNTKARIVKTYKRNVWYAVTDTTGTPKLFDQILPDSTIDSTAPFLPITQTEIDALKIAVDQCDVACCSNLDKPLTQLIGFVHGNPAK